MSRFDLEFESVRDVRPWFADSRRDGEFFVKAKFRMKWNYGAAEAY